jgi:cell division protein FtsQ
MVAVEPYFKSEKHIIVSSKKETVNPPKKFFLFRWFQKKQIVLHIDVIEKNPYVENVECYKTQGGNVVITLSQKMPVLRVMADNGDNYYIDSKGTILPANKYTSNMVIATGNISRKYAKNHLLKFANYIIHDKFWHNQIVQLNILPEGDIEIVPRVGEHIIYLGKAIDYETKLKRLEKFYKYGLSQAGWNKYSYINIEFDNQIICKKKQNKKTI